MTGSLRGGLVDMIPQWLDGAPVQCSSCGHDLDMWTELLRYANHPLARWELVAQTTTFATGLSELLRNAGFFLLDLRKFGIADDATIYDVTITPQYSGDEVIGIVGHTQHHLPFPNERTELSLMLAPATLDPSSVQLNVRVSWSLDASLPRRRLIEAFTHLGSLRHAEAVLAANVAVEVALGQLMSRELPTVLSLSARATRDFLRDASFSTLLSVVLPLWCQAVGVQHLPASVTEGLNDLRKLRNAVAHGNERPGANENNATKALAAAAATLIYFESLDSRSIRART